MHTNILLVFATILFQFSTALDIQFICSREYDYVNGQRINIRSNPIICIRTTDCHRYDSQFMKTFYYDLTDSINSFIRFDSRDQCNIHYDIKTKFDDTIDGNNLDQIPDDYIRPDFSYLTYGCKTVEYQTNPKMVTDKITPSTVPNEISSSTSSSPMISRSRSPSKSKIPVPIEYNCDLNKPNGELISNYPNGHNQYTYKYKEETHSIPDACKSNCLYFTSKFYSAECLNCINFQTHVPMHYYKQASTSFCFGPFRSKINYQKYIENEPSYLKLIVLRNKDNDILSITEKDNTIGCFSPQKLTKDEEYVYNNMVLYQFAKKIEMNITTLNLCDPDKYQDYELYYSNVQNVHTYVKNDKIIPCKTKAYSKDDKTTFTMCEPMDMWGVDALTYAISKKLKDSDILYDSYMDVNTVSYKSCYDRFVEIYKNKNCTDHSNDSYCSHQIRVDNDFLKICPKFFMFPYCIRYEITYNSKYDVKKNTISTYEEYTKLDTELQNIKQLLQNNPTRDTSDKPITSTTTEDMTVFNLILYIGVGTSINLLFCIVFYTILTTTCHQNQNQKQKQKQKSQLQKWNSSSNLFLTSIVGNSHINDEYVNNEYSENQQVDDILINIDDQKFKPNFNINVV